MRPFTLALYMNLSGTVMIVTAGSTSTRASTDQIDLVRGGFMTIPNQIHVDLGTQTLILKDRKGITAIKLQFSAARNLRQAACTNP